MDILKIIKNNAKPLISSVLTVVMLVSNTTYTTVYADNTLVEDNTINTQELNEQDLVNNTSGQALLLKSVKNAAIYADSIPKFTIEAISDTEYALSIKVTNISADKVEQKITIKLPEYMKFDTSDDQDGTLVFNTDGESQTVTFVLPEEDTEINKTFFVTSTDLDDILVEVSSVGVDGIETLSKVQIPVEQIGSADFEFTQMNLVWNSKTDEEMNNTRVSESNALKLQFLNLPINPGTEVRKAKITLPKELHFNTEVMNMPSYAQLIGVPYEFIPPEGDNGEAIVFDISSVVNTKDLVVDIKVYGDTVYSGKQLEIKAEFLLNNANIPSIPYEVKSLKIFDYITEMEKLTGNNSLRAKIEPYKPTELYEDSGTSYIRVFQRTPTIYSGELMSSGYRLKNIVTTMDLDETLSINGIDISDYSEFVIPPRTQDEVDADTHLSNLGYDYTYNESTHELRLISDSATKQGYSAFPVVVKFPAESVLVFDSSKIKTTAQENSFDDKVVKFRSEVGPSFTINPKLKGPAIDVRLVPQDLKGDEWGNYAPGNEDYISADGQDQFLFTLDVYNKSVELEDLRIDIKVPDDVTITGVYIGGLTPNTVYPIKFYNNKDELLGELDRKPDNNKFMFAEENLIAGDYYVVFERFVEMGSTSFDNVYHDGLWYDYGLRFYGRTNVVGPKTFSIYTERMTALCDWDGEGEKEYSVEHIKGTYGGDYVGDISITVGATDDKKYMDVNVYSGVEVLNSAGTDTINNLTEGGAFVIKQSFGVGAQALSSNRIYYEDPVMYISVPPNIIPNTGVTKNDIMIITSNNDVYDLSKATIELVKGAKGYNAVDGEGSVYRVCLNDFKLDEDTTSADVYVRFKVSGDVSAQTVFNFKATTVLLGTNNDNSKGVFGGNYSGSVIKYTDAKDYIGAKNPDDVGDVLVAASYTESVISLTYSPRENLYLSYGVLEDGTPKYHIDNTDLDIEHKTPESQQIMDVRIKHNASGSGLTTNPYHITSYFIMPNKKMKDGTILYTDPYDSIRVVDSKIGEYKIYYTKDTNIANSTSTTYTAIEQLISGDKIVSWTEYRPLANESLEGVTGIKIDIPVMNKTEHLNLQFKFKIPHITKETQQILVDNSIFESQLGNIYKNDSGDSIRYFDDRAMIRVTKSDKPKIMSNLANITTIDYYTGDTTYVNNNLIPTVYDDMEELHPVTLDMTKSIITVDDGDKEVKYTLKEWVEKEYTINNKVGGPKTYTIKYVSTDYDDSYQQADTLIKTIRIFDTLNTIPHDINIDVDKTRAEQSKNEDITWVTKFLVPSNNAVYAYSAKVYLPQEVDFDIKNVVVTGIPSSLYSVSNFGNILTIKLDYSKFDEIKLVAGKPVVITIPSKLKNQPVHVIGDIIYATAESIVNKNPSTADTSNSVEIISFADVFINYIDSYTNKVIDRQQDKTKQYYFDEAAEITVDDDYFGKYYKAIQISQNIIINELVENVDFYFEKDLRYWKDVTVNLINIATDEIMESFTSLEKIDVEKEITPPIISGYTLVSGSSIVIIPEETNVVDFYYEKVIIDPVYPDDDGDDNNVEPIKPIEPVEPIIEIIVQTDKPYIFGYEDGSIRPNAKITRAEFVAIIHRLLYDGKTTTKSYYSDVNSNKWYANSVNYLTSIGVLGGYADGTFRPNDPIRRDEVAAIISRVKGNNNYTKNDNIIIKDYWATNAIYDVVNSGIMIGYPDKTFGEDKMATRAEVVVSFNKLLGRKVDNNLEKYGDAKIPYDLNKNHFAYYDMLEASIEHDEIIEIIEVIQEVK